MPIDAIIKNFAGNTFTSRDFAVLMESLSPEDDGRLNGCTVKKVSGSNDTITISNGRIVICGRIVRILEDGTSLQVGLPSSGTIKRHVIVGINRRTGNVTLSAPRPSNIPEDTPGFNTVSTNKVTNPMGYVDLATLTITRNGITDIENVPRLKPHDNLLYRKIIRKKKLFGNKDTGYDIILVRHGNVVVCNFIYIGVAPYVTTKKTGMFALGQIIPVGYRPDGGMDNDPDHPHRGIRLRYIGVSTHNTNWGRGQWIIRSGGNVYGETDQAGYIERCGTISWITNDDYPAKVYEDLDDT